MSLGCEAAQPAGRGCCRARVGPRLGPRGCGGRLVPRRVLARRPSPGRRRPGLRVGPSVAVAGVMRRAGQPIRGPEKWRRGGRGGGRGGQRVGQRPRRRCMPRIIYRLGQATYYIYIIYIICRRCMPRMMRTTAATAGQATPRDAARRSGLEKRYSTCRPGPARGAPLGRRPGT